MKNQAIIQRIEKLTSWLKGRSLYGVHVAGRDGGQLRVNFNTGACELTTWLESHHNGDPYDTTTSKLTPEEACPYLEKVEAELWSQAEVRVTEAARKEREREERAALRKATKLAVFGK